MHNITKKNAIRKALDSLLYHLEKYNEYKHLHKYGKRKPDRNKAYKDMIIQADFMYNVLTGHPEIIKLIDDGNAFLLEEFHKYAGSDVPRYIEKLQNAFDELDD